jgi:MFS family permease
MVNQEDNPPIKTEPRFFYGYVVVIAAFSIVLFGSGFYQTFGVFFKPMISEFGWTRALTSGAFSLSHIVRGLMGILMGVFTDKLGARIVLTICGFLIGSGFLLMSQINDVWQLYLLYVVLIGIGMSGVWVPLLSTVARWFTKRRSTMTGIVAVGLSIGTIIMPPVTNWLIYLYDWRITYLIMGGIVLVIVVLAAQFLKREPTQMRQLSYGKSGGKEEELKSGTDGFTFREAVYTSQFWLSTVIVFCAGFWRVAILVHIVPHVTDQGFSPASASNILAIIGGVNILGIFIGGSLSDRLGSRQTYVISFILMSVASLWLLQAKEMWMLYIFTIIFGLGSGLNSPLQSPLIARTFGLRSHGMIFGATNTFYAIGAAVGPFIAGYIFDVTGSYQLAFLISAALGIVGLIFAAVLRPAEKMGGRI